MVNPPYKIGRDNLNEKAKVVAMDKQRHDGLQESLALLRMLELSEEQLKAGRHRPIDELFDELERELDQKDAESPHY